MSYDNWRERLDIANKFPTVAARRAAIAALKINFSQPQPEDEGYYRKPIGQKDPRGNGATIITGWIPVAYFLYDGVLTGNIGFGADQRNMTDNEIVDEELWSYVVSNPISYEMYQAVAENGEPWPDQPDGKNPAIIQALETEYPSPEHPRVIDRDHNQPPQVLPEVEHAAAIDNAIGATQGLKVTTAEEAAIAAGAANVLRDRRLAAEKVAKAKVNPLKEAYDTERAKWAPPITRAKTREDEVRALVSAFEASERKRIAAEQLAALEKQREIDEANARAADRAIAAGVPEQAPVLEEVVIPQAAPRVTPTYGSYKPREKPILKFAVIADPIEVCKHFIADPALLEVIQKLATNAVRANLVVPGATFREGTE